MYQSNHTNRLVYSGNKSRSGRTNIIIVVAVVIAVILGVAICAIFRIMRKPKEILESKLLLEYYVLRSADSHLAYACLGFIKVSRVIG